LRSAPSVTRTCTVSASSFDFFRAVTSPFLNMARAIKEIMNDFFARAGGGGGGRGESDPLIYEESCLTFMAGAYRQMERSREIMHQAINIRAKVDKSARGIAVALFASTVQRRRAFVGRVELFLPLLLLLLAFLPLFRRLLLQN
jgi:hypothetical protein